MENLDVVVTRHDEQIKTLFKRLDAQDKLIQNVNQLAISVEKLALSQRALTDEQKEIKKDVAEMKEQPLKDYRDLKKAIIISIATGIVTLILGYLAGKFM